MLKTCLSAVAQRQMPSSVMNLIKRLIYYETQDDNTELDLLLNSKNGFAVHISLYYLSLNETNN